MEIETIISFVVNLGVPILIGVAGSYFLLFKKKIKEMRNFIVDIDDAVTDDKVTEEEFQKIYADAKALIQK